MVTQRSWAFLGVCVTLLVVVAVLLGPGLTSDSLVPPGIGAASGSAARPAAASQEQSALLSATLTQLLDRLDSKLSKHLEDRLAAGGAAGGSGGGGEAAAAEDRLTAKLEGLMSSIDATIDHKLELKLAGLGAATAVPGRLAVATFGGSRVEGGSTKGETSDAAAAVPPLKAEVVPSGRRRRRAAGSSESRSEGSSGSSASSGVPGDARSACRSQSVKAPKDWCGIEGAKTEGCFDKWEKDYMEEHADKLSKGLKLIRAPGCFPTGTSIATMGYFRTGSTLLYNIARVWASLAADPSLVAGWMCKDPRTLGIGVLGEEQAECTSVCKDHSWHTGIPESISVVLMSRRDPFYSVCSRKLMDVWCNMDQSKRKEKASWDEIYAFKKKCKAEAELEMPETVRQCYVLMAMQADIYFEREMKGKTIAYDVLSEDYKQNPEEEVRNIGRAMGICEDAVQDDNLVHLIVQMGEELKRHPDHDMGITQMHDVHTSKQRREKCSSLEAWMRTDPGCRAWMDANASHRANVVLQGYMQDIVKKKKAKQR